MTVLDLMEADEESLLEITGIATSTVEQIYSSVQKFIEREDQELDDDEGNIEDLGDEEE